MHVKVKNLIHPIEVMAPKSFCPKLWETEKQIMSKDKYPSIVVKSNGGYCVYYPSHTFCNAHRISLGYSPVLAEAYSVTHLE